MTFPLDSSGLTFPIAILIVPFIAVLLRYFTLHGAEVQCAHSWMSFLGTNHVLCFAVLLTWCTLWETRLTDNRPWIIFWLAPIASSLLIRLTSRVLNKRMFSRKWTAGDILKQAWWATAHPTGTLLMMAIGFDGAFQRKTLSLVWFLAAGVVATVGTVLLRFAQGVRPRRVKSGTLYIRAMRMAKRVGVQIKRVYVVPSGKGNLANAFGSSASIALTDNFGEYLDGAELDDTIGHELAHAKNRHARKRFTAMVVLFCILITASFILAPQSPRYRSTLLFFNLLVPIFAYYAISRRFEYEADRDAVRFTGNAEAGICALAAVYAKAGAPIERSRFLELFATHPNILNRVFAISHLGNIPRNHVLEILADRGLLVEGPERHASAAKV